MSKEKQLFQVQNILDTILEATDHFIILIKTKELQQSIFMFTSIVEGCQSIITSLNAIDRQFSEHTSKLQKYLQMITSELEQGNFIKIAEIIQFSFRPQLIRLKETFIETAGDQQTEKTISIGIFNSWHNPSKFMRKQRLEAMLEESKKQNTELYFFTSEDVDFEKKQINADNFQHDSWKRVTVPFPDVIDNVGAGKRSHVERKLRRQIPFTTFYVGNKYTLPKQMAKLRRYTDLLVPFKVCTDEKVIYDFFDKNNHVVFKALKSNRGENIFFVTKKGNRYVMQERQKEQILNADSFHRWLQSTVLREKGSYIIQRYIHTRTKENEPYHFRATVQKNRNGAWVLTDIYSNIGKAKGNLSNLSAGGRMEAFKPFLIKNFGKSQGLKYEKELIALSLDVTKHLDKLYDFTLSELGIDFAIDENGKIWMHEANNGPQTDPIEEKRAVHKIGYAKYIAENGIMYTESAKKSAMINGHFQARTSILPFTQIDGTSVGMLTGKHTEDTLTIEVARKAENNNIYFYQFTPKDIDFDYGLIKAQFYEKGKWTSKVVEYPDVIIDRLKLNGKEDAQVIYDELEDIPFTNEWAAYKNKRSDLYEILQINDKTTNYFSDFQKVIKPRNVFQFIERYENVLLKPENMAYPAIAIEQIDKNNYKVIRGNKINNYHEMPLRNMIEDWLNEPAYIVQRDPRTKNNDGELFELHVHLMKDENDEWAQISQFINTLKQVDSDTVELDSKPIAGFTQEAFGKVYIENIQEKVQQLSTIAATELENTIETPISELFLAITVDKKQQLSLLEINPNGPDMVYDENTLSSSILNYANSISIKDI